MSNNWGKIQQDSLASVSAYDSRGDPKMPGGLMRCCDARRPFAFPVPNSFSRHLQSALRVGIPRCERVALQNLSGRTSSTTTTPPVRRE